MNKRIELLMAHGQRHTAIAKQIQQQRENCLQILHAKTLLPPQDRGALMAGDLGSQPARISLHQGSSGGKGHRAASGPGKAA